MVAVRILGEKAPISAVVHVAIPAFLSLLAERVEQVVVEVVKLLSQTFVEVASSLTVFV